MPTLPAVIVTLLLPFEHLFDPRTWRKAQLLAMGAILSPGKRTVSSALNILGIGQHGDFAVYHHVLNRARWSPLQLSRARLLLVAGRLGSSTEPLVFGIDETVERRWGRKIAAKGRYRDPVRSKDDQVVMSNCSDLRGSEQLAAGGEGVQASCAPGAEDRCQRHLALGTTFRPGAAADLAADNQMAQAALGGVVVRRHVRFGHEDEEFLDVALDAPAQPALQS